MKVIPPVGGDVTTAPPSPLFTSSLTSGKKTKKTTTATSASAFSSSPRHQEKGDGLSSSSSSSLPRKLVKQVEALHPIVEHARPAIALVASKQMGEKFSRESIRALYSLAYALHRPQTITTTTTTPTSTRDGLDHPQKRGVDSSWKKGDSDSLAGQEEHSHPSGGTSTTTSLPSHHHHHTASSSSVMTVWSGLPYHVAKLETSEEKHVTSSQIGGQLHVLLRPVLRRLEDRVREAERLFGNREKKSKRKIPLSSSSLIREDEEEDMQQDTKKKKGVGRRGKEEDFDGHLSDMSEEALDEEIERLLQIQEERRKRSTRRKGEEEEKGEDDEGDAKEGRKRSSSSSTEKKDKNGWRYAFGKGNEEEEDDDEEDKSMEDEDGKGRPCQSSSKEKKKSLGGADDDDEEEEGEDPLVSAWHRRAMMEAGNEEEDDDKGDADDELAALKEMYGEDFEEEDGKGFLENEDDDEDQLEEEEEEEDDNPASLYREQDGKYYGGEDMLQDPDDGMWGAGGEEEEGTGESVGWGVPDGEDGHDKTAAAASSSISMHDEVDEELKKDEELQAFLQRTDVSDLQKELMIEKKKVGLLEQRRLYGVNRWSMTGEVNVTKRPRDALLELDQLDFDYGMKSVPVITEMVSKALEERIKDRILKNLFDDVVRRKEVGAAAGGNAEDVAALNAKRKSEEEKKSSLSLMDLYEKEYTEKQRLAEEKGGDSAAPSATPLTEIERDELRAIQMWKRLGQHLDALSNFYFTPKPVQQDLEARIRAVDGQAPALLMESVGAFASSREMALAPQDVYRAKKDSGAFLTGTAERSPEERRAHRRKMKERFAVKQKIIAQNKQKIATTARRLREEKEEGGGSIAVARGGRAIVGGGEGGRGRKE